MTKRTLAIVGLGPRGLYATECLVGLLNQKQILEKVKLLLFEQSDNLGNGWVYDTAQSSANWMNVAERVLTIQERTKIEHQKFTIPAFPSYEDWAKVSTKEYVPDFYPLRAKVGKYLEKRFATFVQPLLDNSIVKLYSNTRIQQIEVLNNNTVTLRSDTNSYQNIDEALLTIGHQDTYADNEIEQWEATLKTNKDTKAQLFKLPYPIASFLQSIETHSVVAVRGFGLSTIDIARAIGERFGRFETTNKKLRTCRYISDTKRFPLIVPFSLDGLPPVPKPLSEEVDSLYKPNADDLEQFEMTIGSEQKQRQAQDETLLITAIAPLAVKAYASILGKSNNRTSAELEKAVVAWLKDFEYQAEKLFLARTIPTKAMLQSFVDMATGVCLPSLDFCVGQVWRHCQPSIYRHLSFNACADEVFAKLIHLDEAMKRYAYGPPVESLQQLLALLEAGSLSLDYVNNPDITMVKNAWFLGKEDKSIEANIMINSVLPSPEAKSVSTAIFRNLLKDDLLNIVHDDFGIKTNESAYLISDKESVLPIALLGRLAKGTIIGVDAILECFAKPTQNWAKQASQNLKPKS